MLNPVECDRWGTREILSHIGHFHTHLQWSLSHHITLIHTRKKIYTDRSAGQLSSTLFLLCYSNTGLSLWLILYNAQWVQRGLNSCTVCRLLYSKKQVSEILFPLKQSRCPLVHLQVSSIHHPPLKQQHSLKALETPHVLEIARSLSLCSLDE